MKKHSKNFAKALLAVFALLFLTSFLISAPQISNRSFSEHCSENSYFCTHPGSEQYDRSTDETSKKVGRGWPFRVITTSDYHIKVITINGVTNTQDLSQKTPAFNALSLAINTIVMGFISLFIAGFIFGSIWLIQVILSLYRKTSHPTNKIRHS